MGVYDQAARFAAKADPPAVPQRLLAGSGLVLVFREWLDTRTLPLPGGADRTADLIAALDDPNRPESPWLLVLEFQSQHDPDKLDITLEEVAILRSRARHGDDRAGKYMTAAGLIYLRDRCPADNLDMRFPDGSGTRHAPCVWNVCDDSATDALDAVENGSRSWGTLFWVPLMAGADTTGVAERWRDLALARVAEGSDRNGLAAVVKVFSELTGRATLWKRILEDFKVTESQVANEWIAMGELRKERQLLLRLLAKRFPTSVSADVTKLVNEQDDPDLLNRWFDAAAGAATFADFLAVLKQ